MMDYGALVLGIGLGWITLALVALFCTRLEYWWYRHRYGKPINHGLFLADYGRKLTSVQDQHGLDHLLTDAFPTQLGVDRAVLLLPEGHQLASVKPAALCLPISHAAVRWVASGGEAQPTQQRRLREIIEQSRTDLTWTCVWVPLMRGTRLCGLWLLGERKSKARYSQEDLRCLTSLAREAAAVLEAMTFAEQERQAARELRVLYRQVITAREDERGHLSRELHDGVLQDLCAVSRDLKALQATTYEPAYIALVDHSGETIKALRAICNDLRPPLLKHDLITALKALVRDLDARSNAPVHMETQIDHLHLDDETALAVFRITQEALNNAIVHANASEIAVRLTQYPDRLRLTVTDDGCGILGGNSAPTHFVDEGHFGLAGMRERAAMVGGKLDIQTAIEYGTVVTLELPNTIG